MWCGAKRRLIAPLRDQTDKAHPIVLSPGDVRTAIPFEVAERQPNAESVTPSRLATAYQEIADETGRPFCQDVAAR